MAVSDRSEALEGWKRKLSVHGLTGSPRRGAAPAFGPI